ncbi:MAG: hypothetical protein KIT58_03885 [Planctomycetota bacterium]|nr:hypothetical protein [Planctomycetota bacterium]
MVATPATSGAVEVPPGGMDLEAARADIESQYIQAALVQTHGHLTNAAKLLGITFRAIRYKVKKYELDRLALRDE